MLFSPYALLQKIKVKYMFRGVCLVNLKMEPWYHKTTEEIALRNCLTYPCCPFTNLCPTHCDPMNYSTPGFSVLHSLPEFAQIHVHWVGDAIQPSHPPSPLSPHALNLSQKGLFQWIGSSHQVVKVLELQFQHQSFQWIFRFDFL